MLNIHDLKASKELKSKEMAGVRGGFDPFSIFAGTSITNKVADVQQAFQLALAQGNTGAVTNNQEIVGGNGASWSPVSQSQFQDNYMDVSGIGKVSVG